MRGRTSALKIELIPANRAILLSWLRSQKTPVGRAKRARAVLLLAEGKTFSHTSQQVGLGERHLPKWVKRFITQGISGLYNSSPTGSSPVFSPSGSSVSTGSSPLRGNFLSLKPLLYLKYSHFYLEIL